MSKISVIKVVLCFLLITINGCIPALSSQSLVESDHPYSNNFEYTWPDISRSGATQIQLHFENLDLSPGDKLVILDKYGNEIITYSSLSLLNNFHKTNFSTPWCTGNKLRVKLVTDSSGTAYGFKIDKVESSNVESSSEESSNILTSIDLTSSANSSTFGHSVAFTAEIATPSQATKIRFRRTWR